MICKRIFLHHTMLLNLFTIFEPNHLWRATPPHHSSSALQQWWSLKKCAGLEEDPMSILGTLPNLKHLKLSWAFKGKKLTCKGNDFGQLETLRLCNLEKLENWHLDTTAMSVIKSLSIFGCPKLKKIPEKMKRTPVLDSNPSQMKYYGRFPNKLARNLLHV